MLLVPACALFLALGCGPIPPRLNPEAQKSIDEGWNRALTPHDLLSHQELLDMLIGMQVYHVGIDTLTFRAEKRFSGGMVLMEAAYDKNRPDDDRFVVTVLDQSGKVLRSDRYSRQEIDQTYSDLFGVRLDTEVNPGVAPPPRSDATARLKMVRSLFPDVERNQVKGAQNPEK